MLLRMITKILVAALFAVSAFMSKGLSQEKGKGTTFTRDELDALLVAGRFSRDLQRTKDISPLLARYAVPEYGLWISTDSRALEQHVVSPEFGPKVSPELIRNFHLAVFNWLYLNSVWEMQRNDYFRNDEVPGNVRKYFQSEPLLAKTADGDELEESDRITTTKQLVRVTRMLERAKSYYKGPLRRYPWTKTRTYLTNLSDATDEGKNLYQAESDTCDEEEGCFGMPQGTKYVEVLIEPRFYVLLARNAGKMKIIYVRP